MAPVRARHVLGNCCVPLRAWIAQMAGNPGTVVEQLDGLVGDAGLDGLAYQPIGNGVEMPVHLDVVVEPRPAAPPFGVGIRLCGQG